MKTVVIYTSKYGSTKKYAKWLSESLECPAMRLQDVSREKLSEYDTIIYGGGLYASQINGFKKFLSLLGSTENKKLMLYTVGMTSPDNTEFYKDVVKQNISTELISKIEVFFLQGDVLFSKMSAFDKFIMKMPRAMAKKKPVSQRKAEDIALVDNFGKDSFFADKAQIEPLLQSLNSEK